ncbi:hypothetical protein ACHAWF_018678 [Thalassiosira exigua]
MPATKVISSLDIVQEEEELRVIHEHDNKQASPSEAKEDCGSTEENLTEEQKLNTGDTGLDFSELDDLPSSARNDPFKKSFRSSCGLGKDDDSVSYSDLDPEPGNLATPSIKMCMTVRDSIIEREFATETMTDVEFGDTKPRRDTTMQLLLGDTDGNDEPLDDSMRSDDSNSKESKRTLSTLASQIHLKKSVMKQTSKLDTKAAKRIRRKNKRLWKFCVWNCRKITICLVLSVCVLVGIALLTWWGVTKITGGGNDGTGTDLEPVKESGRQPPPLPTQFPSYQGAPSTWPSSTGSPFGRGSEAQLPSSDAKHATESPTKLGTMDINTPVYSYTDTEETTPAFLTSSNDEPFISPSAQPSTTLTSGVLSSSPSSSKSPIHSYAEVEGKFEASSEPSKTPSPSIKGSLNEPSTILSARPSISLSPIISVVPSSISSSNNTYINQYAYTSYVPSSSVESTESSEPSSQPSSSPSSQPSSELLHETTSMDDDPTANPSFGSSTNVSMVDGNATTTGPFSDSIISATSPSNTSYVVPPADNSTSSLNNNFTYSTIPAANSSTVSSMIPSNLSYLPPPFNGQPVYTSFQEIRGVGLEHAGSAVSITPDGLFVAVGFKEASGLVERAGLVRVYKRSGDVYSALGQDGMFGRATGDEFGASISISNDGQTVCVGARSSSLPDKQKNGEVRVFRFSASSDSWIQLGSPIGGLQDRERLGFSVSLSGDGKYLAVGAPRGNGGTGCANVHEYDGSDWILFGETVAGNNIGDRAGFSVSLSNDGSTLAVGAFTSSNDLIKSGSVSIYKLEGSSLSHKHDFFGATDGAQFGYSIALSGDGERIVIGSNGYRTNAGICEVHQYYAGNWTQVGALIGENDREEAGSHVSISANGGTVSCTKRTFVGDGEEGSVMILKENTSDWRVVDAINASVENAASFGASVSISQDGKVVTVGAPSYNSSAGFFELFESG